MERDELREYFEYYREYVRREPENPDARMRLATALRELGRRERAAEEFENAARLLEEQDRPKEAIAACKGVLEIDPDHPSIRHYLAKLFARTPDARGRSGRVARPLESVDENETADAETGRERSPAADGVERSDVDERRETDEWEPSETPGVEREHDPDEELSETLDVRPEEQPDVSREEMDELLTTVDIAPEDIVEIEDLEDIESFEEEHGSRD
ncbi:MAG: hypothetical protein ABEL76_15135 [Bradymonadaceae bacterium]